MYQMLFKMGFYFSALQFYVLKKKIQESHVEVPVCMFMAVLFTSEAEK